MSDIYRKLFTATTSDIECEIKKGGKNISIGKTNFFHNHDGYEVTLILEGELSFLMGEHNYLLSRGDMILIPPYVFHGSATTTPEIYERIVINLREKVIEKRTEEESDLSTCFFRIPSSEANIVHLEENEITEYCEIVKLLDNVLQDTGFGTDILAETYIKQLLVKINRQTEVAKDVIYNNHMPLLMKKTFQYINDHLAENINLEDISNYVHHNSAYINRCFKKMTGTTIQQYIIAKRIVLAQTFLREGYSPGDAGFMSGFNNYSHFSRTFTKLIGCAPRNYQKECER